MDLIAQSWNIATIFGSQTWFNRALQELVKKLEIC